MKPNPRPIGIIIVSLIRRAGCRLWLAIALSGCQSLPPASVQRSIAVNGATLSYVEQGTGTPIVFLHGAVSDHRAWDMQREAVSGKYRFIALSMRYFGTTPWPDAGASFSQTNHIADVAAFIRELKLGPVILVGTSYGASTAMVTALRHPELVRGLFLNEPPLVSVLVSPADRALAAEDLKARGPIGEALKAGHNDAAMKLFIDWANNQAGYFESLPALKRTMYLDNARTLPVQLAQAAPVPITCEQLGQIKVPTVFTRGDLGLPHLRAVAENASRCIPASRLITFEGARHGAPTEMADAFNDALLAFLPGG